MKNNSQGHKKQKLGNFTRILGLFKVGRKSQIPVPLGMFLLIVLAVLLVTVRKKGILFSRANLGATPKNVKISNITDRSFIVSWTTSDLSAGMVRLNIDGNEMIFRDVRDQPTGSLKKFSTHYIVLDKKISPNRQYEFVIVSGNSSFRDDLYRVKTAQMISGALPKANLAFGQVKTREGPLFSGGIVYLDVPGFSLLSSLTSSQGNWIIPLSVAFDQSLSRLADFSGGTTEEKINVEGGKAGVATAVNFVSNNKPVPVIALGQNYDFRNSNSQKANNTGDTPVSQGGSFGTALEVTPVPVEFKVSNPLNGETVSTPRPQIFGVGPVGGQVKIMVESEKVFKSDIKIGGEQKWSWTVPDNLSPGEHTLTANYISPEGKQKTIIKKFTVLAAEGGTGPAFTASSSATPSPSPIPSPTLAPTVTPVLSPTPTMVIRETMPSTGSGVPSTGFVISQVFLLATSMIFLLMSSLFFYIFKSDEN